MFFNTLPIIFTYTHLFTPLEAGIFLTTIFGLVYFYTPDIFRIKLATPNKSLYIFLRSAWQGQAPLRYVFWPFFILVNGILFYIDYRIFNVTFTIASWKTVHGMLFLPIVWWLVSTWKCSKYAGHKIWSVLARTFSVYLVIELLLRAIISSQFPETLFDCRLMVIEYGDCF